MSSSDWLVIAEEKTIDLIDRWGRWTQSLLTVYLLRGFWGVLGLYLQEFPTIGKTQAQIAEARRKVAAAAAKALRAASK